MKSLLKPRPLKGRWGWTAITWSGRVCFTTPDSRYQAWDTLCNTFGLFNSPIALAQLQGFRVRRKLMRYSGTVRFSPTRASEREREEKKNRSLEALGAAFADLSEGTIEIPQRSCEDVQRFLERLEAASEATRKANIHFG